MVVIQQWPCGPGMAGECTPILEVFEYIMVSYTEVEKNKFNSIQSVGVQSFGWVWKSLHLWWVLFFLKHDSVYYGYHFGNFILNGGQNAHHPKMFQYSPITGRFSSFCTTDGCFFMIHYKCLPSWIPCLGLVVNSYTIFFMCDCLNMFYKLLKRRKWQTLRKI